MPDEYPDACPCFDLSNMNNVAFSADLRAEIKLGLAEQACLDFTLSCGSHVTLKGKLLSSVVHQQAEAQLGDSMVYSLVEWAREQLPQWQERSALTSTEAHRSVTPEQSQQEAVTSTEVLSCCISFSILVAQQNRVLWAYRNRLQHCLLAMRITRLYQIALPNASCYGQGGDALKHMTKAQKRR